MDEGRGLGAEDRSVVDESGAVVEKDHVDREAALEREYWKGYSRGMEVGRRRCTDVSGDDLPASGEAPPHFRSAHRVSLTDEQAAALLDRYCWLESVIAFLNGHRLWVRPSPLARQALELLRAAKERLRGKP